MHQSVGHKKKPRIRNRARNKCNQAQADQDDTPLTVPVKNNPSEEDNPPESDTIKLIQQLLRRKLLAKNKATANPSIGKPEAPRELKTEEKKPPINTAELVKILPLIANQSKEARPLEKKPKAQTAPPQPAPEAPKIPLPTTKASRDVKADEVDELLKCLGSKLQKGPGESPTAALFSNLGKLFSQAPPSDVESSDDEAEYIEYIYKPRQYFMASLCNFCKGDLCGQNPLPCTRCGLSYYCCSGHMSGDQEHRQLCYALRQTVTHNGHDMFYKCGDFSAEQFRSYRIVCIRQVEKEMNRQLTATEQELLLFPLLCSQAKCREHRLKRLSTCGGCGEVAFCKDKPDHLSPDHSKWCHAYRLFKACVMFQAKFGRLEPSLPNKVLRELPMACSNTGHMMKKLNFNVTDECEYAALTQVSTGPLTAWFALKLCERLRSCEELTIHLIGAEIEFEVDVLQKWELFLLHITPVVKTLNVVFIGPELNPNNISFDQLKKIKCCRLCRKFQRTVNYFFENSLYHDYCKETHFLKPSLVCFFNSGLYRSTGYALEDTWPDTIQASLNLGCPIVVTSYTKYEAPLDMVHFINQSNRHINVVLPPTINPFSSEKPERNFISDDEAPFMFKNFYCFVVE
ncbi:uncharacterized protein [Drosophila bipectinata]|uniref:uncharacterized protein n=1 Tax=Drosophila bipectinata TaxID=42026 RepID=UPI001C8A455B|nr:uncharacterized protein LOC108132604 [Drosophila bipectinata]